VSRQFQQFRRHPGNNLRKYINSCIPCPPCFADKRRSCQSTYPFDYLAGLDWRSMFEIRPYFPVATLGYHQAMIPQNNWRRIHEWRSLTMHRCIILEQRLPYQTDQLRTYNTKEGGVQQHFDGIGHSGRSNFRPHRGKIHFCACYAQKSLKNESRIASAVPFIGGCVV
jgi:hypothetical protein